jgi:hypothetical protein
VIDPKPILKKVVELAGHVRESIGTFEMAKKAQHRLLYLLIWLGA